MPPQTFLHTKGQDLLAAVGVGATSYSWVAATTEVVQLVAALLGVCATVLAIRMYVLKIKTAKKEKKDAFRSDKDSS